MAPVFEHADLLFRLLGKLVSRPKKTELPGEVPQRDGIPILSLVGNHQDDLAEQIEHALNEAQPRAVPFQPVDMEQEWDRVVAERGDETAENYLNPAWQRAELCRRILVELASKYSSDRYGNDRRVRFRRLGLVNWLLQLTDTAQEPDSQHGRIVLRRLRDRELERRRFFGFMRSPSTEVALQGTVPWWAYIVGLYLVPIFWFRVWRGLGREYRWLLHQPYMAPADPGTFIGFAVRLTQPRWGREDPQQISKLLIDAFLEDLRVSYRRRPWRRSAHRRTAYCVAFLQGVSKRNHGQELVRLFAEVRNDIGAFDPLLLITTSPEAPAGDQTLSVRELTDNPAPYDVWCEHVRSAGGGRPVQFWYLPVRVPGTVPESDERYEIQRDGAAIARRLSVPSPPAWTSRAVALVSATVALAVLGGTVGLGIADHRGDRDTWRADHCGLSRDDPDAETVWTAKSDECVGVAPHGFAFGSSDERVRKTMDTIAAQNTEAERIHKENPARPLVTLVHMTALLTAPGRKQNGARSYAREQLQGAASAQRRQLDNAGDRQPVLRIFPASAGSGMRHGAEVARRIEKLMASDPSIVGVTGLDQSRKATITTIDQLTEVGLPMVATTLSADSLPSESSLYYQVSPLNRREAAVAAAYAGHLVAEDKLKKRVRVVYSLDPTDEYSENLRQDAAKSFTDAGFEVDQEGYVPSSSSPGTPNGQGTRAIGEQACGYEGLVFFAGRSEDFETILGATNDTCGSNPPTLLGGDDVARLGADPERRRAFPRVPFEFLDFTVGSASCDGPSDLYSTMKELFPEECRRVKDTSLDGHAALAFDAVNLYMKAISRLRDTAPGIPLTPSAVWHALSRIHGRAALDGESGVIDFGGGVDQQVPLDKLISVQRVEGAQRPQQMGFCGRQGAGTGAKWCPPPEEAGSRS
ncbi:ABC transporter substrate-binding protein [Streptomyces luteolus]|uniref:ABC transporter substrate-binding protein n=1 Tax=Streptomyces luteolus TaxID=3043615 RepID=A0ABT6T162_9ACTN|nr:ABC transporter substrate-binding protein [Streptomyces sp. B-S-A12]MDI3421590.1 ABC transporter substrate-binding protein [Streptomyces sp. B-S-A12]